jgi:hypothetical protein
MKKTHAWVARIVCGTTVSEWNMTLTMRKVQEFDGNTTDRLWEMMGSQLNPDGTERHGQSCFMWVYPTGSSEGAQAMNAWLDADTLQENETPAGPIAAVAEYVLENYVRMDNWHGPDEGVLEYDGLRVGAGWIYSVLLVAQSHGCTQAVVVISSNDGNLAVECWDRKLGAYVSGVHNTYYGT